MIMKLLKCLFILALALNSTLAQNKPLWNATIKVIDEAGQPIAGADAKMSWNVNASDGTLTFDKSEGLTDTNGIFSTSHEANGSIDLAFSASKSGYYSTRISQEIAPLKDSDPAKWNHNVTLMLKKIGKPIAMYAKWVNLGMPVFDKPVGYDLMIGSWTAPYGSGINADILFTGHFEKEVDGQSNYTLTVSFPNSGDGIQGFTRGWSFGVSSLQSAQEAPIDGYD
jgi:hypothetical protein